MSEKITVVVNGFPMTITVYPEHNKLKAVQEKSQAIGEFLDWLQGDCGVVLAKYHKHSSDCFEDGVRFCSTTEDFLSPQRAPISHWLSRYFDIDEEKLEEEKLQMLDELRSKQPAEGG
jgi:hypothetical protein